MAEQDLKQGTVQEDIISGTNQTQQDGISGKTISEKDENGQLE